MKTSLLKCKYLFFLLCTFSIGCDFGTKRIQSEDDETKTQVYYLSDYFAECRNFDSTSILFILERPQFSRDYTFTANEYKIQNCEGYDYQSYPIADMSVLFQSSPESSGQGKLKITRWKSPPKHLPFDFFMEKENTIQKDFYFTNFSKTNDVLTINVYSPDYKSFPTEDVLPLEKFNFIRSEIKALILGNTKTSYSWWSDKYSEQLFQDNQEVESETLNQAKVLETENCVNDYFTNVSSTIFNSDVFNELELKLLEETRLSHPILLKNGSKISTVKTTIWYPQSGYPIILYRFSYIDFSGKPLELDSSVPCLTTIRARAIDFK
ncbi:MAG: hypothetical protein ACK5P5_09945 [Pseudobdellovibrionaceae bacterium]